TAMRASARGGQLALKVPQYQPDNDLSVPRGNGHNDANNANIVNNDWYGYLGRAYVMADILADGFLHVFDPVLASPVTYGYQKQANLPLRATKLDTYEDPYRVFDLHNEVTADISFKYTQPAINLKQYPHGASDLAQQGTADAALPNTAWAPFDVENTGNVNLVAVAPWHYDNANQQWHLLDTVFNQKSPFFSDQLFGQTVGPQPADPHIFLPRSMIWWSAKPRGMARAFVGKLPKAQ